MSDSKCLCSRARPRLCAGSRRRGGRPQKLGLMRAPLVFGLGLLAVGACTVPQTQVVPLDSGTTSETVRDISRELAVETFDSAWSIVYETHFDTTFNGIDWLALKRELRPRAAAAGDTEGLRLVIEDMLARLGQSHFALIPSEKADSLDPASNGAVARGAGDPGLDVRLIGDQVVVSRVDEGGAAAGAGVKPGWVVVAVEGEPVARLLETARHSAEQQPLGVRIWKRVMSRLAGPSGTTRQLTLLDGDDRDRELDLVLEPRPGIPVKFGNFPTFFARFESRRLDGDDVSAGVIWFNNWMVPLVAQFDAAVDRFRELDGVIIDLRGNTGGLGAMVMGVAGHFYTRKTTLGIMKTRDTELRYFANPRRTDKAGNPVEPYGGPTAILIDEMTASASEIFAGGMQTTGRVRVFGQRSMGAVLPAATKRLPNGDVLYHAIGDFATATGERLEGRGVLPDEPVRLTREALLQGVDSCLVAALRWIEGQGRVAAVGSRTREQRRKE